MIRVMNVRGLNRPDQRAGIVYVGRPFAGWPGHPLANPLGVSRWATASAVGDCLSRYADWLDARPTLAADLAALWAACEGGRLPLGCWCCEAVIRPRSMGTDGRPTRCHAEILAARLIDRFGGQTEDCE